MSDFGNTKQPSLRKVEIKPKIIVNQDDIQILSSIFQQEISIDQIAKQELQRLRPLVFKVQQFSQFEKVVISQKINSCLYLRRQEQRHKKQDQEILQIVKQLKQTLGTIKRQQIGRSNQPKEIQILQHVQGIANNDQERINQIFKIAQRNAMKVDHLEQHYIKPTPTSVSNFFLKFKNFFSRSQTTSVFSQVQQEQHSLMDIHSSHAQQSSSFNQHGTQSVIYRDANATASNVQKAAVNGFVKNVNVQQSKNLNQNKTSVFKSSGTKQRKDVATGQKIHQNALKIHVVVLGDGQNQYVTGQTRFGIENKGFGNVQKRFGIVQKRFGNVQHQSKQNQINISNSETPLKEAKQKHSWLIQSSLTKNQKQSNKSQSQIKSQHMNLSSMLM